MYPFLPTCKSDRPFGVVAYVSDRDVVVSVFEFQSCYYVHFRPNIKGKGMTSFTPPPPALR